MTFVVFIVIKENKNLFQENKPRFFVSKVPVPVIPMNMIFIFCQPCLVFGSGQGEKQRGRGGGSNSNRPRKHGGRRERKGHLTPLQSALGRGRGLRGETQEKPDRGRFGHRLIGTDWSVSSVGAEGQGTHSHRPQGHNRAAARESSSVSPAGKSPGTAGRGKGAQTHLSRRTRDRALLG